MECVRPWMKLNGSEIAFTNRFFRLIINSNDRSHQMKSTFFALTLFLSSAGLAHADGSAVVVDYAEKAMAKGYGTMCSLTMMPSASDGYYPCLDFGPYRYVREYQKVSAYVVGPDKKPFKVMGGTKADPRFTIGGPWETDMAARMVAFWNDTVEGGADKAAKAHQTTKERQEAEAYVRKMMGGDQIAQQPAKNAQIDEPTIVEGQTLTTEELRKSRTDDPARPLAVNENDIKEIMKKSEN